MTKFIYKVGFWTHEVELAKEMITYKGKTIPEHSIIGLGFSFIRIRDVAIGQALGGAIGGIIASRTTSTVIEKDLSKLPEKTMGQMIITYNNEEQNQKVLRIPITTKDENCKTMLQTVVKLWNNKFVGFGNQAIIEKELKISQKAAIIFVAIIIAIALFVTIYASSKGY